MRALAAEDLQLPGISYAMQIIKAAKLTDYHTFFVLYRQAPDMSGFILDFIVAGIRAAAYAVMLKAYMPLVPIQFINSELGFDDMQDCLDFLKGKGAVLSADGTAVDTKASRARKH